MRALAVLSLLALTLPAAAASLPLGGGYGAIDAQRKTDPLALAELFCAARVAGDMSALTQFYAPKLEKLLAETPADKVAWQSYPDQPAGCAAKVLNGFDDTVGVLVEVSYVAEAHRWADTLNLERTPDSWLLNNVFYEGGGNLRFKLFNAAP